MPRRTPLTLTALTAATLATTAVVPAAASAGMFSRYFKKRATTTQTAQPTPTPTPTPAAQPTTSSTAASNGCTELPTTKAFQTVDGDSADYSLAPGGDFESGVADWTLSGGAKVQSGNESLGVSGGNRSLRMPLGSTATSPTFCVDEQHPHFRFAYRVDNASLTGFIAYVVWRDARGAVTNIELLSSKVLALTPSLWQATPGSPLATLLPLGADDSATVQLKVTALNPTDLVVDTADAVTGSSLSALTQAIRALAGGATNLVAGTTAAITPTNIGISIDSVMVDPYRRG